jgi:regulator of protease activity HflC (stomatin/prohibitin superfamily)
MRRPRPDRPAPGLERKDDHVNLGLIAAAVLVALVFLVLFNAIKVVREYQRLVVFRLGRVIGTKGPGLVFLIPFVDKATTVDLREFFLEIPRQDSITKDNAPIAVDFIMFYKVLDPRCRSCRCGTSRVPRSTSPRRPCAR